MKRYLPFLGVILLAVVFVGGVFIIRNNNANTTLDGDEEIQNVPDLPEDQKPVVALVPRSDGHYLTLKIQSIKVTNASSMDYVVEYKANNTGTPTTQGTSGAVKLENQTSYEKELLLGSESSGKFRYDKEVGDGKLTIRFRDKNGKMLGKVATDWKLQTGTTNLSSVDGSFKYTLDKVAQGVWFVTMKSFKNPSLATVIFKDGWAIYASDGKPHSGK